MIILEKYGVENTNIDGGAFNNFAAGGRNGIMQGVLNECAVTRTSSNTLSIASGELIVHGIRMKLMDSMSFVLSSAPASPIRYQLIADVTISEAKDVTASILMRTVAPLVHEELYRSGAGHYQAEIATFTHAVNGNVEDIIRTMEVITGGAGDVKSVAVGSTTTLPAGSDAAVSNSGSETRLVLDFAIPRGQDGASLYGFAVENGCLVVSSAVADTSNIKLQDGHLVFDI